MNTRSESALPDIHRTNQQLFSEAERHLRLRQIYQALSLYSLSERAGHDPDACAAARWTCQMLLGKFEAAWAESERIEARGNSDPNRFWDGKPVDGRSVVLRCLHGLGDTMQFVRYAPLIRSRAKSLTIETQPVLKELISASRLADHVVTWGDPIPFWNQQIEVIELPRIFRTTIETIPRNVPYLHVPFSSEPDHRMPGSRPRIGLAWASGTYNRARCIPYTLLAKICCQMHCEFYGFQVPVSSGAVETSFSNLAAVHFDSESIVETARHLQEMDLVITVDTMLAHLAGALALPVWTLLPSRRRH